jgi:hypothetical protein
VSVQMAPASAGSTVSFTTGAASSAMPSRWRFSGSQRRQR